MRFVKAGIQKYIDLINEFAQKEGDEFNRSVYHQHIGDLNQAIKRIEDYDPYMETPASIEDEAERLYPYKRNEKITEIHDGTLVDHYRDVYIDCGRQYMGEIEKLRAELESLRKLLPKEYQNILDKYEPKNQSESKSGNRIEAAEKHKIPSKPNNQA